MKTKQPTKLKLSLRVVTTSLLVLILMLGCAGMFSGKMGATSQNIPYVVESAADAQTSIGNLQYLLNNNFNKIVQLYSPIATYESTLPSSNVNQIKLASVKLDTSSLCPSFSIDSPLTLKVKITTAGTDGNTVGAGGDGTWSFVTVDGTNELPLSIANPGSVSGDLSQNNNKLALRGYVSSPLSGVNDTTSDNGYIEYTVQVSSAADLAKMRIGLMTDTDNGTTSMSILDVKVSYDDTGITCPNNNPSISPSSTTIPSSTPSGSTVVAGSILKATDPDGDKLNYSITLGNDSNYFVIDPITGDITTTKTNIPSGTYTLTIQVDDGKGGKATANVSIVITDGGKGEGTNNNSSASSTVKVPSTGAALISLILIPIALGTIGYLYIARQHKNSIKKKSER
jgi:hypothetical protein